MNSYIECPLIVMFVLCGFIGYAVDKLFSISGEIKDLKSEVKIYAETHEQEKR